MWKTYEKPKETHLQIVASPVLHLYLTLPEGKYPRKGNRSKIKTWFKKKNAVLLIEFSIIIMIIMNEHIQTPSKGQGIIYRIEGWDERWNMANMAAGPWSMVTVFLPENPAGPALNMEEDHIGPWTKMPKKTREFTSLIYFECSHSMS